MNTQEVLQFIQRILSVAPTEAQAGQMLMQLRALLNDRRADFPNIGASIRLIDSASNGMPETLQTAREKTDLTPEDLAVANRRKRERLERERQYNRC